MYKPHQIDADSFEFFTDKDTHYTVIFAPASFYYSSDSKFIDLVETVTFQPDEYPIQKVDRPLSKIDPKIAPTIAEIIKTRCEARGSAILFVCDSVDKKEGSRSRLFHSWNNTFNGGKYHFQPTKIEYEDGILYAGLIVQTSNPNSQTFIKEFQDGIKNISNK